jgi:C1A family cysteine protease
MPRNYNWIPDKPDARDFLFRSPVMIGEAVTSSDLRPQCTPIGTQVEGSCTAQVYADIMEMHDIREKRESVQLSRYFIYYNERKILGTTDQDSGARLRDGIKALYKWGVPPESLWPYQRDLWDRRPPDAVYKAAQERKITSYWRANTLTDIKYALSVGLPVALGFLVYASFETPEMGRTGICVMPKTGEEMMGGHAVGFVGHQDGPFEIAPNDFDSGFFWTRNSWGPEWGPFGGYFKMPYRYAVKYASDFWVIKT